MPALSSRSHKTRYPGGGPFSGPSGIRFVHSPPSSSDAWFREVGPEARITRSPDQMVNERVVARTRNLGKDGITWIAEHLV